MSDVELPDDGVPTFGWVYAQFRAKKRCGMCNRKVWVGIVSLRDRLDPTSAERIMCASCYRALDREEERNVDRDQ